MVAFASAKVLFPGVAQLVARLLWEQDAAGSSPVTPTSMGVHNVCYEHPFTFGFKIEMT